MNKIKKYFTEVAQETKKVTWPTKDQTMQKTALVIGVSVGVAIFIGGLDFAFQEALALFFIR